MDDIVTDRISDEPRINFETQLTAEGAEDKGSVVDVLRRLLCVLASSPNR